MQEKGKRRVKLAGTLGAFLLYPLLAGFVGQLAAFAASTWLFSILTDVLSTKFFVEESSIEEEKNSLFKTLLTKHGFLTGYLLFFLMRELPQLFLATTIVYFVAPPFLGPRVAVAFAAMVFLFSASHLTAARHNLGTLETL